MFTKHHLIFGVISITFSLGLYAKDVSFSSANLLNDEIVTGSTIAFAQSQKGDIDLDGDLDIVVSHLGTSDELVWLENDGTSLSNYTKHTISTSLGSGNNPKLVDLDQDSDLDIVIADLQSDALYWFENNSNGTSWTQHVIENAGITEVKDITIADFDGDGDPDLAITFASTAIYWYENVLLASSWVQHDTGITAGGNLSSISSGDFDMDGSPDILFGLESGTPSIEIILNDSGDGSTWSQLSVDTGASSTLANTEFADLDLDGTAEVYSNSQSGFMSQWTFNFMIGTFSEVVISTSGIPGKINFADIDLDGDLDIVSSFGGAIGWNENIDGDGSNWTEHHPVSGLLADTKGAIAIDLDMDGDQDIVYADKNDGFVYSLENLQFHSKPQLDNKLVIDSTFDYADFIISGLYDIGQHEDLIVANNSLSSAEIQFYSGNGDGSFAYETTIYSNTTTENSITALAKGDLDGDGDLDIVFAADGTDSVYLIENQMDSGPFGAATKGATWSGATNIASGVGRSGDLLVIDINQDGKNDIVVIDQLSNKMSWLDNDGSWTEQIISSGGVYSPKYLAAGDIDGNGSIDLLGASTGAALRWWSNDGGDGLSWTESSSISGVVPYAINLADMDHDGDLDLIQTSINTLSVRWFENNGTGTVWTSHDTGISAGSTVTQLDVMDFDHDGDLDIIFIDDSNTFTWLESTNPSIDSWQEHTIASGTDSSQSFTVLDADNDGDYDLISHDDEEGTTASVFSLYENRGGQFSLHTSGASAQNSEERDIVDVLKFTATHNGRDEDGDIAAYHHLHLDHCGSL